MATPLVGSTAGSARAVVGADVGVADGVADVSAVAAESPGVREPPVPSLLAAEGPAVVCGGTVGAGKADPVDDSDGVGVGDGSGGVVRLVAGGGASGGVGDVGPSGLVKYSGTAMRAATAQVAPSPAAVRSRRRRDALRRIAS